MAAIQIALPQQSARHLRCRSVHGLEMSKQGRSSILLEGKSALVFGAAGHLGRHLVDRFKAEGAEVFASSVRLTGSQPESHIRRVDAANEAEVDAYIDEVVQDAGSVDLVVNMAAAAPRRYNHGRPASEVTPEQFVMPLALDTASQFITAKSAYRYMSKQGRGVIVFNTSTLAKVGSPWSPALSAAHAATEGLMRSLAHE